MTQPSGYKFYIRNSDNSISSTRVDMADMFVPKNMFMNTNLLGFGLNQYGQLGNSSTTFYSSPVQVGSLTNWKQVAAGQYHSTAIKTDGTLWVCGYNNLGQLGNSNTTSYSSPIQIGSLSNWQQVAAGRYFTSAIKTDGTLWTWGYDAYGQLGINNTTNYSSPVQVGTLTNWRQVACGDAFALAVKTDNTLWAWGDNFSGQLSYNLGYRATDKSSPTQVGSLTTWKSLDPDTQITVMVESVARNGAALSNTGQLWMWGSNIYGQLGNGSSFIPNSYSSPIQVGSLTNWKQIGIGSYHTAAVKTDGTLWTWGRNNSGQLGNNNRTGYSSPVQIGSLTDWKQVAGGGFYCTAVKTDGTLWAWGYNLKGQLGNSNNTNYSSPIQVGSLTDWKQVSCSYATTAAVKTDGTLWTWGENNSGQIGNNTTLNYNSPVQVGSATNWKQVACGQETTFAIKTDGTLWSWGSNGTGQLGNGNTINYSSPVQVGNLTNWKQVTGSRYSAAAVKTDNTIWAWGNNGYGEVNYDLSIIEFSSPVQIGTLANWQQVYAGDQFIAAVKTDGTLWGWGLNNNGQLGIISSVGNEPASSPIQVGSLTNWKQVACGYDFSLAITTEGALWTWGYNGYGQLGNNNNIEFYSSPVQVGSLTNWKQLSAGQRHAAAVKTDGTLWAWGSNTYGQLGINSNLNGYSSPVQVGSLTNWKLVSCGESTTLAIKTDGTLWGWGRNNWGTIGNGNRTDYSSPVQVGSLTIWKQISGGVQFTIGVTSPDQ